MTRNSQGKAYVKSGEDKLTYHTPPKTGYNHSWRKDLQFKITPHKPPTKPVSYTKLDQEKSVENG